MDPGSPNRPTGGWIARLWSRLSREAPPDLRFSVLRASGDSLLNQLPAFRSPRAGSPDLFERIERLAAQSDQAGRLPLWEGYRSLDDYPTPVGEGASRSASEVRTDRLTGEFYAWLVALRRPEMVVEFGAAFGISGMYWLAGMELAGCGQLFSFEPNQAWARIARSNMAAISARATLIDGTFEDNIGVIEATGKPIDIAFIDAIHRSDFVFRQLDLVCRNAAPGSIVILDDINFSPDMTECWAKVAAQPRFRAAAASSRVGIVELG